MWMSYPWDRIVYLSLGVPSWNATGILLKLQKRRTRIRCAVLGRGTQYDDCTVIYGLGWEQSITKVKVRNILSLSISISIFRFDILGPQTPRLFQSVKPAMPFSLPPMNGSVLARNSEFCMILVCHYLCSFWYLCGQDWFFFKCIFLKLFIFRWMKRRDGDDHDSRSRSLSLHPHTHIPTITHIAKSSLLYCHHSTHMIPLSSHHFANTERAAAH